MRIHNEEPEFFIQSLATAIGKDPASLENWRCLHIGHTNNKSAAWFEDTLTRLRDTYQDMDCEVIHCSDKDVLFISRHLQIEELYEISDDFIRATYNEEGQAGEVALYDVFRDWRIVRSLLLSKAGNPIQKSPEQTLYGDVEISLLHDGLTESKKNRTPERNLHVMLVEDDLLTRRMVSNALKNEYTLISAKNAQEAITNYLTYAPEIVFLDIGLPDASGFDILQLIVASDAQAYIVMFSGNSYLENIVTALSEGAAGFISKPFKKDKMRHYIEESAAHHRQYTA